MHSFLKVESFGATRCRKSWNQFERYDSPSLHVRHASIREKKGPSLEKKTVKVPHQRSPNALKFEDISQEQTDVPEARFGILLEHIQAQRKRQGCILFSHGGMGTPGCVNTRVR